MWDIGASSWFYYIEIYSMHGPMNVKFMDKIHVSPQREHTNIYFLSPSKRTINRKQITLLFRAYKISNKLSFYLRFCLLNVLQTDSVNYSLIFYVHVYYAWICELRYVLIIAVSEFMGVISSIRITTEVSQIQISK